MESAHTKAYLLLQAHFEHARLPITDYINDTKSVLDQAPRIMNALVDIAADEGLLDAAITAMELSQVRVVVMVGKMLVEHTNTRLGPAYGSSDDSARVHINHLPIASTPKCGRG